jgi:hypothetical protein
MNNRERWKIEQQEFTELNTERQCMLTQYWWEKPSARIPFVSLKYSQRNTGQNVPNF